MWRYEGDGKGKGQEVICKNKVFEQILKVGVFTFPKVKILKNWEVHVDCGLVGNDVLWPCRRLPAFHVNLYAEDGGDVFPRTLIITYKATRCHNSDHGPHAHWKPLISREAHVCVLFAYFPWRYRSVYLTSLILRLECQANYWPASPFLWHTNIDKWSGVPGVSSMTTGRMLVQTSPRTKVYDDGT